MRVVGLDLGDARIGVAISDELGITAQGLGVIRRTTMAKDLETLRHMIEHYAPEAVVLGFPRNMDGSAGPRAEQTQQFAESLRAYFGLPVILWDERLSTVAAERMLLGADVSRRKRRDVIDKIAAMLILQNYLDAAARKGEHNE
jgi:putative Holliday junction resolvase